MPASLTPRQQRFAEEYIVDCNATQAAIRAGYSPVGAEQYGHILLEKTQVSAAIQLALHEKAERTQITGDMVLYKLWQLGNSADGHVAVKALELVGKHLRMFPDRHEISGRDGNPIEITSVTRVLQHITVDGELISTDLGALPAPE
jgi:phage terminase small subunit